MLDDKKPDEKASDEKISDEKGTSPPKTIDELPERVIADDPTEDQYYAQFANNGEEWRTAFEKKLMRKVDFRLIPLLVIMYVKFMSKWI